MAKDADKKYYSQCKFEYEGKSWNLPIYGDSSNGVDYNLNKETGNETYTPKCA